MVRLRNEWAQIDPRAWDNSMDVSINIGLGQGDVNERLQGLMMIMQKQEQALSTMGADNPFVTMTQFSRTLRKIVELSGFRDASQYFKDVPEGYMPPAKPERPTPEQVLAQVQAESIQADIQKKAAELELKREQMIRDDDYRRDQLAQDLVLKKYELELKYGVQLSTAELDAQQSMDREALIQQSALMAQAMQQPTQAPVPPINPNSGMVQ